MNEQIVRAAPAEPIAIVGVACRFPDAADPAQLLELAVAGRRAFRRIPPVRLDGQIPGSGRAALIEGWRFDAAAFGVSESAYRAADPAQWLALETAARALSDGGFPGGQGLTRDRAGVVIGNTLAGEVSRTAAMQGRWPFVRRVLSSALSAGGVPAEVRAGVIERAAEGFLSPLPRISDGAPAGGLPSAIADRICGHFGFRGGGHAVDSAHSSSLLAVATACSALAAGDLDAAIAGGVDVSLDPFELAGLSRAGMLADDEMRVFDARPTGFWPGEGCGLVLLMRAADARKANVPVYGEIAGWGVSSAGSAALARPGSGSLLLALRRAYVRARVDPADVQLIEGDGAGTASGDLAELTSLAEIRGGAAHLAAISSVKANIGHTKAAAGAAGLIKATLASAAGVIPPATGCVRPHPLIASRDANVRAPRGAEAWPEGTRLAGVSAVGPGGTSVHLVIRRDPHGGPRRRAPLPALRANPAPPSPGVARAAGLTAASAPGTRPFLFGAEDRTALVRELSRVAEVAPWLSDGEFHDLAHSAARQVKTAGPIRVSVVAAGQDQLASFAREAVQTASTLRPGMLTAAPGIFAADGARGRVALLFPGEGASPATVPTRPASAESGGYEPALQPAILAVSLAAVRWLRRLGVDAPVAVGHGLGEIAGLVWAGCLSEQDAAHLVSQRAQLLGPHSDEPSAMVCVDADAEAAQRLCADAGLVVSADNGPRCQVLAGPVRAVRDLIRRLGDEGIPARVLDAPHGLYSPAMADRIAPLRGILSEFTLRAPSRRLMSTITGAELSERDDLVTLLCTQLTSPVRFAGPLRRVAAEVDLLVETGPGEQLSLLAADCCDVPAVSLSGGRADDEAQARVVGALFAAGAIGSAAPLLAGQNARPIDIWRERTFIANPCGSPPPPGLMAPGPGSGPGSGKWAAAGTECRAAPPPHGRERPGPGQDDRKPADAPPGPPGRAQAAPRPASATAPAGERPHPARPAPQPPAAHPAMAERAPASAADLTLRGVAPWVRIFAERLRAAPPPDPSRPAGPWRLHLASRQPFARTAGDLFPDERAAGCVLAVLADPGAPGGCATLLGAARAAVEVGSLVVISAARGLAGFCASLRAEHPSLGVTVIEVPEHAAGLRAARPYAAAAPGEFRELRVDRTGTVHLVAMAPAEPAADGPSPLGPADVVLISGMTRLGDLACAASLSCRGAALAVLAPPGPADPAPTAYLAELRSAGIRVARKKADPSDPGQVAAAVRSLERELGPITAVAHAAAPGSVERCVTLQEAALRNQVAGQRTRLANLLAAVGMERVRLLLTFGSVSGRYGRPDGASGALLSGLLPGQAARLTSSRPRCRTLHVDWPEWLAPDGAGPPDAGGGEKHPAPAGRRTAAARPATPPGAPRPPGPAVHDPIPVSNGWRLLCSVLETPDFAGPAAIHGRVGAPAPPMVGQAAAAAGQGRFLESIRLRYPGVELIAETRLSLPCDPYLADHRLDGLLVLPAAMALEAMAQVASALAGAPLRHAAEVAFPAPVVLPAGSQGGATVVQVCALRRASGVEAVLRCAETGFLLDHARAVFRPGPEWPEGPGPAQARQAGEDGAGRGGIVDGADLYGPVLFQDGRFRRVAFLPGVSSRSCRALVRGGDDQPWFPAAPGSAQAPLILGSPGLNDASLHVLQACLPHRRVLVAGCESADFSGREVRGALHLHAERRGGGAQPGAGVWDVRALDATGQPVTTWRGVRLRDVGPLAHAGPWHPALLAVSLEGRAAELGLDPALRAVITSGRAQPAAPQGAGAAGGRREAVRAWRDTAPGRGPLDGFELRVEGSGPLACAWEAADPPAQTAGPGDAALITLHQRLTARLHEPPQTVAARLRTVAACLAALGRSPGDPAALDDACDGGWIVVRGAAAAAACCVTRMSGTAVPVAVAIARTVPAAGDDPDPRPAPLGAVRPR